MLDLEAPARQLATVANGVADDQLAAPTPCEQYTVRDLVNHILGLTLAFRDAARKDGEMRDASPEPADVELPGDWRDRLATQLDELVAAWREPAAWDGMTRAGGVSLPGEVAGYVALDEIVLHGWDLARATGQPYDCDPASVDAVWHFVAQAAAEGGNGLFGPPVEVPEDAPLFDRALGLSGRDPAWAPCAAGVE